MHLTRRNLLAGAAASVLAPAFGVGRAAALEPSAAQAHVRAAVDDVLALVRAPGDERSKVEPFRALLERYAAMPQIARFAAGPVWRDMSEAQQARYADAFAHFLAVTYARRFSEYGGETVTVGAVSDAGRRGLRVESRVSQQNGAPVLVEWLVSDRPGRIVIADIVIEQVSLIVTQREEIGAMLSRRGGDVERLIADLAAA